MQDGKVFVWLSRNPKLHSFVTIVSLNLI